MKTNIALSMINNAMTLFKTEYLPPLAIVILDNRSQIKASISDDGVGTLRHDIALGKASAALGMGFGTRQLHTLIKDGILPEMFANCINGAATGNFIPLPGGVLILNELKEVIGAIGISGANSNQDESIAIELIKKEGLLPSP